MTSGEWLAADFAKGAKCCATEATFRRENPHAQKASPPQLAALGTRRRSNATARFFGASDAPQNDNVRVRKAADFAKGAKCCATEAMFTQGKVPTLGKRAWGTRKTNSKLLVVPAKSDRDSLGMTSKEEKSLTRNICFNLLVAKRAERRKRSAAFDHV